MFQDEATKTLVTIIANDLLDMFLSDSPDTFRLGLERGLKSLSTQKGPENPYPAYLKLQGLYDRFQKEDDSHRLLESLCASCQIWGVDIKLSEANFRDLDLIHEFKLEAERKYREKINKIRGAQDKEIFKAWAVSALDDWMYLGPVPENLQEIMVTLNDPPAPEGLNQVLDYKDGGETGWAPVREYRAEAFQRDEELRKKLYEET